MTAPKVEIACPFPGPRAFTEDTSPYFCGRENDIIRVVSGLLATEVSVLYGPSGVGKTSLLQAGVVPRLRNECRNAMVMYCNHWPPRDPLEPFRPAGSREPLRRLLHDAAKKEQALFIILDQFEEFLGIAEGEHIAELCEAINDEDTGADFLLSIREDCLARLDHLTNAIPDIFRRAVRLRPLSRSQAEQAIREPVARFPHKADAEVSVEEEFARDMADELATKQPDRGIDPLLIQIEMSTLWEAAVAAARQGTGKIVIDAQWVSRTFGDRDKVAESYVRTKALDPLQAEERRLLLRLHERLVSDSSQRRYLASSHIDQEFTEGERPKVREVLRKLVEAGVLTYLKSADQYLISLDRLAQPFRDWCVEKERDAGAAELERARSLQTGRAEQERATSRQLAERLLRAVPYMLLGAAGGSTASDPNRSVRLARRAAVEALLRNDGRALDIAGKLLSGALGSDMDASQPLEKLYDLSWRRFPADLSTVERGEFLLSENAPDTPRILRIPEAPPQVTPEPKAEDLLYGPAEEWS